MRVLVVFEVPAGDILVKDMPIDLAVGLLVVVLL